MANIEISPYERKDILEVLEFARQEYIFQKEVNHNSIAGYWIMRIEELKKVINGKVNGVSLQKER